ncbi:hypothetical protein M8J76_003583 [Diaphorina citri]|nr:hypothetical protein M8J75_014515 [Diaphorina citri]KAI5748956.1 hypothetical protein M8J76_003583 [Diaphorina citri]KAI5754316.1 hypothetical protein M8J77_007660 [Diaphorina citri]
MRILRLETVNPCQLPTRNKNILLICPHGYSTLLPEHIQEELCKRSTSKRGHGRGDVENDIRRMKEIREIDRNRALNKRCKQYRGTHNESQADGKHDEMRQSDKPTENKIRVKVFRTKSDTQRRGNVHGCRQTECKKNQGNKETVERSDGKSKKKMTPDSLKRYKMEKIMVRPKQRHDDKIVLKVRNESNKREPRLHSNCKCDANKNIRKSRRSNDNIGSGRINKQAKKYRKNSDVERCVKNQYTQFNKHNEKSMDRNKETRKDTSKQNREPIEESDNENRRRRQERTTKVTKNVRHRNKR